MDDGTYLAVLDRFEDETAVLVLQIEDEDVGDWLLEADVLPEEGRHEDAVFEVRIEDGTLVDAEYRPKETEARGERAQSRFDRLSKRPPEEGNDG